MVIPILFVIIFIIALVLIYSKKEVAPVEESRTAEQILIDSMTATGPSTLSDEERVAVKQSTSAKGSDTLTAAQEQALVESMSVQE